MKNIIFITCLIAFSFLAEKISAQAPPQKMTYQFVARNAQNQLIQNNAVGLRISILQGAPNGNAVYVETHTPQTNGNGTATIEVGGGTPVSGVFANIDWSTGVYFIQTEMDPQGQQSYSVSAVSQLLTVPYAFYAARSTRATFADSVAGGISETDPNFTASVAAGITPADTARWNQDLVDDADNNPTNELQTLTAVGNTISLSNGGGSVSLTERDSIFAASVAAGITAADTTRWNNGGNDWKLSGNVGTDPNSNFIGTTDFTDLVIKTNNLERMRISKNGDIGIGVSLLSDRFSICDNSPIGRPFAILDNSNLLRYSIDFEGDSTINYSNIRFDVFPKTVSDAVQYRYFRKTNTSGEKRVVYFTGNNTTQQSASIGVGGINSYFQLDGGNFGIGTISPTTKLQVSAGDVYVDNIGNGVILKSPNGSCWRVTVDNTGNLVRTAITCP
jgi:hypothetical protein